MEAKNKRTLKQVVRSLEENIITISGPALAISGVIAGIDVLTAGIIKTYFPIVGNILGVTWAICLMLTLDFQVLTLGVKASRVYRDAKKKTLQKLCEMLLAVIFACAIGFVSVQMGTIFAQSLGTNYTIEQAEAKLGINPTALFYERSAMVMLLIFMSGWLRDVEEKADENATQAVPTPLQGQQSSELADALKQIAEMNRQTLASMQAMQQQQMQVTIEQATRVTVEAVKQSLEALPFNQVPQLPAPQIQNTVDDALKASPDNFQQGYRQQFEELLKEKPDITVEEAVKIVQCSEPTAKKWLEKLAKSAL